MGDIANFRNRIVHDYLKIDLDIVWEIIKKSLPPLKYFGCKRFRIPYRNFFF